MLYSYIRIALRSFLKRRAFSAINILGLSLGFSVCLILWSFVKFELSYDRHHQKAAQTYRTVSSFYINGNLRGTYPLSDFGQGPALLANIPEVNSFVRTHLMHGGAIISNYENTSERRQFYEDGNIQYVDSNYFDLFTHEVIEGNVQTALDHPNEIVLTETAAQKYFGNQTGIIGRTLNVSGSWWTNGDYTVSAIIKDVPQASHFRFDFLISTQSLLNGPYRLRNGTSTEGNFVTYVELSKQADLNTVRNKLPSFLEKYQGEELRRIEGKASMTLQPVTDIHLTPGYNLEMSPTIDVDTLYFFIAVSILVILLAWTNYINLSTARAIERAKEVGIKKAIGVHRYQLITQFMTESLILHIVSGFIAIAITYLVLPNIRNIVNKDLVFDLTESGTWILCCAFVFIGSVVAAIYPSLILSSFKPVTVLKGINDSRSRKFSLRQLLVVVQFSISIFMTASTFVVIRQLDFMQGNSKGFDSNAMLVIKGPGVINNFEMENKVALLKSQLANLSIVNKVATSEAIPGGGYKWGTGMRKIGADIEENRSGEVVFVDSDFAETYKMKLLSGKVWNDVMTKQVKEVLVNEMALKTFGFHGNENVIGEKLLIGNDTFEIAGVLADYHWSSLKTPISSNVLASRKICGAYLSVQLNSDNWRGSIDQINELYSAVFPEKPFDYFFLEDFFNRQYQEDRQFREVVSLFALLSILIASLGLWGIVSYSISQRSREISIRKVLGASIQSILLLLTHGFLKLILIACVIVLPLFIYGINTWLDNFAYKISPSWDLYLIPVTVLIFVSICTISATTVKAALTNPAENLRRE